MRGFLIAHPEGNIDEKRCANLNCKAILEPPLNVYTFIVGEYKLLYQRAFCVDCMEAIKSVPPSEFYFRFEL